MLASLNHPRIATLYGLEDSGRTHALVMEFVDGPTLGDRIAHGPIPWEEARSIALQLAGNLSGARAELRQLVTHLPKGNAQRKAAETLLARLPRTR